MSKYLEEITLMTAELSVYCNSKYGPGWLGSMCRVWKQVHTNQSGESIMNSYVWAAVLRWRAAPVSTLTTAPQQYSPAQPSPAQPSPARPGRAENEWMLGWAGSGRTAAHTTPELQSYRVTEYSHQHSYAELSSRVALIEAPLQLYMGQSKYLQCLQQEASLAPSVL